MLLPILIAFMLIANVHVSIDPKTDMPILRLTPPPIDALASNENFGSPLNTTAISLMAYYSEPTGWNLSLVVGALQSYTNYGNYLDGVVRVWEDATGTTYTGADVYIDVSCRIRTNGWVLTWFNRSQSASYGYIIYFGHGRTSIATQPVANSTTLSRAMNRIFYACSKTFPGHTAFLYWDFERPTATRLIITGRQFALAVTGTYHCYATVGSSYTVIYCVAGWGGYIYTGGPFQLYFDAIYLQTGVGGASGFGWTTNTVSVSSGVRHDLNVVAGTTGGYDSYYTIYLILWLV